MKKKQTVKQPAAQPAVNGLTLTIEELRIVLAALDVYPPVLRHREMFPGLQNKLHLLHSVAQETVQITVGAQPQGSAAENAPRAKVETAPAQKTAAHNMQPVQFAAANSKQVGGTHYRVHGAAYQHWDYAADKMFDYFQGVITKYVERWKYKCGVQDLEKARHYLDKYIEVHEKFLPTK